MKGGGGGGGGGEDDDDDDNAKVDLVSNHVSQAITAISELSVNSPHVTNL